ncbi:MAG TPA: peptidyl-dipeptidase Dcp [Saprospiraceae bacterium]|jgi:peptidyl-dipeptidase Dcp|nr:peptidyl-dipeptidase Dcp [Saprospiraceae bacterium]HRO09509.1 peptidyl-dipeptidase Dcp [Saprospiraceae bacterium]HRP42794.1 peptidyl-dipeptidase Dcp [Saprospiraceae bacterium]
MNKSVILLYIASLVMYASCKNSDKNMSSTDTDNIFFQPSTLPFQAIPFDRIKDGDFEPAFEKGMQDHLAEVEQIANNVEEPTFKNTLIAMEQSGQILTRVSLAFNVVSGANTNPELQDLQERLAPQLAAHKDAIHLNANLFKKIEALYNNKSGLGLDPESLRLLEYTYQSFVLDGAKLSDADKSKLMELNKEEASLSARFNNQLLDGTKAAALVVSDKEQLEGLTDGEIEAAAVAAKENNMEGKWYFSLKNTTQQPLLMSLKNRSVRENLFQASWTRTEKGDKNDTRSTIARIAQIRAEKARLIGYDNYASWSLQDQMAKTPEAVDAFLKQLIPASVSRAKAEARDIQQLIDRQKGGFELEAWDWDYYAEQVRKEKYDLDENLTKPYFELNSVLENGVFYAANKLFGISFKERKDLPVYHPDVRVFTVLEENGDTLGLFYCDFFKRDNKNGGAWMDNMVGQSKLFGTKPVIYNVCNYTKPVSGQPALISFDDVTTTFHEFGHALHGLFANQMYPSLSGTNVPRDFVEFPSQFNEKWALYPEVLKNYAKHYQTGEAIPDALVDKIKNAATFNQGYAMTELLAAADLDLQWHKLKTGDGLQDVDTFEADALKNHQLNLKEVPPRYRSSYFLHIWANGYAAGYYAYLWAEMLDHDAYSWFQENGGMTRANGQRLREMILSQGNSQDLEQMYLAFRGKKPVIEPMLKNRGLK